MGISGEKQRGRGTSPIVMMVFLRNAPACVPGVFIEPLVASSSTPLHIPHRWKTPANAAVWANGPVLLDHRGDLSGLRTGGGDVSSHKVPELNICRGKKRVKKMMGQKAKQRRRHQTGQTGCFYWEMLIGLVRMGDYKNTPQN